LATSSREIQRAGLWRAASKAAYRYGMASFGVTPYAALQTQWFHTPDYRETDLTGGGFGLAYNAMTCERTGASSARASIICNCQWHARFGCARVSPGRTIGSAIPRHGYFQILPARVSIVNGAAVPSDSALIATGAGCS